MKIFNWVHRRFVHKDELGENGKKNIEGDDEGNFVVDADEKKKNGFCGWKGGILTIGTFGYDPLILLEDDDRDDQNDDVIASFIYAPKDDQPRRRLAEKELEQQQLGNDRRQMITENNNYKLDVVISTHDSEEEEQPLLYAVYDHDYNNEGLLEMKTEEQQHHLYTNEKERTTLADLFSADSELMDTIININEPKKKKRLAATIVNNMKEDDHVIDKMMTTLKPSKSGHSFARLHKPRPIHKLHRLMKRVMKRKIHPAEIGGGLNNQFPTYNYSKVAADITESASLLS